MTALTGCAGVLRARKVRRASAILPGETGEQAWLRGLRETAMPWLDPGPGGVTYLLCFERAYWHARHYTGWTVNLPRRLRLHSAGRGANLIRVITAAGITFQLARVWPDTTDAWEAKLKRRGGATRHCPICNPATAFRHAQVPQDKSSKLFRPAGYDVSNSNDASAAALVLLSVERTAMTPTTTIPTPLLEVTTA